MTDTCYADSGWVYSEGMDDEVYWDDECSNCHWRMGTERLGDRCPHCGATIVTFEEWRKTHKEES